MSQLDPTAQEISIPFNWKPRDYQLPLWRFLEQGGKRGVAVWHRRAGKDLFGINWCCTSMIQRPGLYWHLFPTYNQGRKIAWDGYTKTGRRFLDHFPSALVDSQNNTDMRLTLKTGGTYQVVGTEDPDRLVGANPVGCIFSEYSLQDPKAWDFIRPILAENEGWALFIYTARGRNHGYTMIEMAKKNPKWHAEILDVDTTGAVSKQAIQDERESGMPEEMIQQEFYCSFDAPIVGAYYGELMMKMLEDKRICNVPYESNLLVHTAWDLGVGDATSIVFYQVYGHEIRIIDYYENSGEGLAHYAKILNNKEYAYQAHYAPWDIEVRELGTGKTRLETARSLGIRFKVGKQLAVDDGIEAVRNMLPKVWIDETKCGRLIECLRQYRKEWDDKKKTFKDNPYHDWTSHGADAMRTMAWGFKGRPKHAMDTPAKAKSDYDPLKY